MVGCLREEAIDKFIAKLQAEAKDLKGKATTSDLCRIDAIMFAIRELELAKELDRIQVGRRLQDLTVVLTADGYDDDDRNLARAGIAILNEVGKYLKSNA